MRGYITVTFERIDNVEQHLVTRIDYKVNIQHIIHYKHCNEFRPLTVLTLTKGVLEVTETIEEIDAKIKEAMQ